MGAIGKGALAPAAGLLLAWTLTLAVASAEPDPTLLVHVDVQPQEATIGDHLAVRIDVTLPAAARLDPPQLGPALGPFSVIDGSWEGPIVQQDEQRWTWNGAVVSFRTGELELPPVRIAVEDAAGAEIEAVSEAVPVTIQSVLDSQPSDDDAGDLADLKAPASVPPHYGPLFTAAGILVLLLLGAALLWWLQRRYASRLAAVPAPDDPFHRTPPHEWFYSVLGKLLDRRLAEQGNVALFFEELARIVKLYLGGRYRVEIMEQTTAEVPRLLRQVGATSSLEAVADLLRRCDMVKFASTTPDESECRAAIEAAYRIVDTTKPQVHGETVAQRGAA